MVSRKTWVALVMAAVVVALIVLDRCFSGNNSLSWDVTCKNGIAVEAKRSDGKVASDKELAEFTAKYCRFIGH